MERCVYCGSYVELEDQIINENGDVFCSTDCLCFSELSDDGYAEEVEKEMVYREQEIDYDEGLLY